MPTSSNKPSEWFLNTLGGRSGPTMECQCGIMHLCLDAGEYQLGDN